MRRFRSTGRKFVVMPLGPELSVIYGLCKTYFFNKTWLNNTLLVNFKIQAVRKFYQK